VLGVALPAYTEARLASIDLTEIQPAEYRADVVVLLFDGDLRVRVIIVEVQHLVYNSLNEAARRALEAMMKGYEFQSAFAKKYVALGRDEGRDEGRAEEAARALLTVFRVRGIAVPEAARERILAQKDPERLERWLERAIVAASVAEVLDEPS
jgi:hypothetical protein